MLDIIELLGQPGNPPLRFCDVVRELGRRLVHLTGSAHYDSAQ